MIKQYLQIINSSIPTYDTMQASAQVILLVENLGCESGFSVSCVHLPTKRTVQWRTMTCPTPMGQFLGLALVQRWDNSKIWLLYQQLRIKNEQKRDKSQSQPHGQKGWDKLKKGGTSRGTPLQAQRSQSQFLGAGRCWVANCPWRTATIVQATIVYLSSLT